VKQSKYIYCTFFAKITLFLRQKNLDNLLILCYNYLISMKGEAQVTYICNYNSPLGSILLSSANGMLTGLWFAGQKYYAATLDSEAEPLADLPLFSAVRTWLDAYFAGENPAPTALPLAPGGGAFRQFVWRVLLTIPQGTVLHYGAVAKRVGCASAQAVGGAVAHNPISIIIPCHRVIGQNGSLTGYAGGLGRKMKLLNLENVEFPCIFTPLQDEMRQILSI
jgi:methylated-DNA-[protein]-cysteine S-methyltransferase